MFSLGMKFGLLMVKIVEVPTLSCYQNSQNHLIWYVLHVNTSFLKMNLCKLFEVQSHQHLNQMYLMGLQYKAFYYHMSWCRMYGLLSAS